MIEVTNKLQMYWCVTPIAMMIIFEPESLYKSTSFKKDTSPKAKQMVWFIPFSRN